MPERRRAALVIEKLAKDYARFFDIRPYLWESEPMLASGHFQDVIVPPSETDIVVLVLWARLGTPLPEARYQGLDGRAPVTGTEWEFESALAAHRERGLPDLLAYRKEAPPRAEFKTDADLDELRRQWQALEAFWGRHFVDKGEFRAAFSQFADLDTFEAKLEGDLRRLIERRIAALGADPAKPATPTWLKGSPFRGLEIYRFEHAPIFFGRSDASKSAVERLVENAESGKPFLLVLGASGAGKSSLAQAGIVPALGVRGVVPGVGAWRRAVMRPGGPGGPFPALAVALTSEDALPELLHGQDAAALSRHLEAAAADPGFLIVAALSARTQAARQKGELLAHEDVRLVLVADQLEELFTLGETTPEQRKAFVLCLKGLLDTGRVFVVATMRSDYWHRAAEVPLLVTLAEGRGRIDLLPPTQAEVAMMIARPAEVAGLSFETDPRSDIGLDAALAEEASRQPGALPLLSFLLDALYAEDVQAHHGSVLRYATMRKLGGFQGAIATRAEETFAALPAEAQAALPKVLRALVTVSRSGAEPTARAVSMERFAAGSAERVVVEAFLDPQVRLLVADGDGSGAQVRFAHEALITHWDRARRQIAQDRDDLRTRAVVEEALAEWQAARPAEKRGYLLRDPQLANALDLAKRWREEFAPDAQAFVQASQRRARMVQRLVRAAAAVLALSTGAATLLAVWAYNAERTAAKERDRALIAQSRFITESTASLSADHGTTILMAIEALPDAREAAARPHVAEAETALLRARQHLNELLILSGHAAGVTGVAFSPDGNSIVTASHDKVVRRWDAKTGASLGNPLSGHTAALRSVAFSLDGRHVVTTSEDGMARIWDLASGRTTRVLKGHTDQVVSASFSPDARRVLTTSLDQTARIWDAGTGEAVLTLKHEHAVTSAAFSPDGKQVVTASNEAMQVWNAESGEVVAVKDGPGFRYAQQVQFHPDGRRIVAAGYDRKVRIWDIESGKVTELQGHSGIVQSAVLSADGRRIVSASHDGSALIWDVETAAQIGIRRGHAGAVWGAAFSPDGKRVATAGADGTARIWSTEDRELGVPLAGHTKEIRTAAFSPDGRRVITASSDKTARIWDAQTGRPIRTIDHAEVVVDAVFAPSGRRIVTVANDAMARIWDAESGAIVTELNSQFPPLVSPNGQRLFTVSDDNALRIWDTETAQTVAVLKGSFAPIRRATFSANGELIAIAFRDGTLHLFEVATGQATGVVKGELTIEAFSPNGRLMAELFGDHIGKVARIRDARTGQQTAFLAGHDMLIISAAFSPDSRRIVTASWDQTARIWDVESGALTATLAGHGSIVLFARFSPDGRRVVTAAADKTARIWDVATGQTVGVLAGHPDNVNKIAFSRDGQRLITISSEVARVWSLFPTTQQLIDDAKQAVPRCLTRHERERLFLEPDPPAWCIEAGKWPYRARFWAAWLKEKQQNAASPSPGARLQQHRTLVRQAVALDRAGNLAGAIEASEQSLKILRDLVAAEPDDAASKLALARTLNALCWDRAIMGQLEQAVSNCNESLSIEPYDAATLDSRGLAHLKLGQFKKAVEDYDAALAMNVRKEEAHLYGRGLAKVKMGDKRGGEADLEEARKTSSRIDQEFAQYGVQ